MSICKGCPEPILSTRRLDTEYCSAACRKKAYRRSTLEPQPPPKLPDELLLFRAELLKHAPPHIIGYRLGSTELGPEQIWFPKQGRSKRYDGCFDDRPFFELRPQFEPPRVPKAMNYYVQFAGPGHVFEEPPPSLSFGIYVPVEIPMCLPGKSNISRRRARVKI